MEKRGTIRSGHNGLSISLAGDQSYVKIFDASGELIRESQVSGPVEIQHVADPGRYTVESDGTIESVRSAQIDIRSDADILGLGQ